MTEHELIAKQALEIANLTESLDYARKNCRSIHMICIGVGGPLNDNVKQYTRDQMVEFYHINQLAAEVIA